MTSSDCNPDHQKFATAETSVVAFLEGTPIVSFRELGMIALYLTGIAGFQRGVGSSGEFKAAWRQHSVNTSRL
ncbi:hypothetical protein J4729_20540 [Leisingera sp. HS039]|uniref:hypothetical protein n=1 Tax=Leisingera sp. HS039 TaxID=2818496 RepID=UPI001B3A6A34|nr:hypothetical protein [Leisingera sp. HS039]MBQ4826913.1 hypothetical protein [Leisingera sp. HS039]